ncbi:MAG: tRNA dihydrouridine(20/20a) synthase DusA [Gammaproteobacteria bacterium]
MSAPGATPPAASPWRLCVAPMMQKTDRHFRYLARQFSPRARLYTEMVTTGALLHGPRDRLLAYDASEQPLAIQLGGSEPEALARCAALASAHGYVEVNLNCGCPSERVQSGAFGACLMREPALVAAGVAAMRAAVPDGVEVTVKTRLGVDDLYDYGYLRDFVARLAEAGCRVFHVHARKAWLQGLSPRENREIPPLEYAWVHRLKRELPQLVVVLNGGITEPSAARAQTAGVDGVMIGRHAYAAPASLAAFEAALFERPSAAPDERDVVAHYQRYAAVEQARGTPTRVLTRHLVNLFQGVPGARRWRRYLSEHGDLPAHAAIAGALACLDGDDITAATP